MKPSRSCTTVVIHAVSVHIVPGKTVMLRYYIDIQYILLYMEARVNKLVTAVPYNYCYKEHINSF